MKTARMLLPLTVLGMALAQGPMPPQPPQQRQPQPQPPDFDALKSYLNLTDAQIRQMQQARERAAREAEEKTRTLRPQMEEKHRALALLLEKDTADATDVGRAVLEIRGLERQMRQAHEAVRNAGINVLTAEQKTRFKAIEDAAMLPEATREAQRMGLVPGDPRPGDPGPGMRQGSGIPGQPMRGPMQAPPPLRPGPPREGGQ